MNYDNVTVKEYMEKKLEMLNDLERTSGHCNGILCDKCPLSSYNNKEITSSGWHALELLYTEKAIEIVMNYEPKVDWTKVPVDTKVLVKDYKSDNWLKRHFAKYEDNKIYVYDNGKSSFTTDVIVFWRYGKLYKENEEQNND